MNVLKLDALFGLAAGVLLVAGFWDSLYDALDLPLAKPSLYAQIAGIAILAFSYLLWRGERGIAGVAAAGNAALAVLLAVWLVSGRVDSGALGTTILTVATVLLAAFAALEARLARA